MPRFRVEFPVRTSRSELHWTAQQLQALYRNGRNRFRDLNLCYPHLHEVPRWLVCGSFAVCLFISSLCDWWTSGHGRAWLFPVCGFLYTLPTHETFLPTSSQRILVVCKCSKVPWQKESCEINSFLGGDCCIAQTLGVLQLTQVVEFASSCC